MQHSNTDKYPNAYCVKCGTETETSHKHTVLLANQTRAMKGLCSKCTSEVYRILPKIKAATEKAPLTGAEKRYYPDAFCLKCQAHTPTKNAHTVILDNRSRAVTGQCGHCSHDVYRIIGQAQAQTVLSDSRRASGHESNKGSNKDSNKDSNKEPSQTKIPGLALPVRANLRLIRSPESHKRPLSGIASGVWMPRVLMGLIMVGLVAIGMMAMNQL
jgi:bacterioferritin-associated ferredoxin